MRKPLCGAHGPLPHVVLLADGPGRWYWKLAAAWTSERKRMRKQTRTRWWKSKRRPVRVLAMYPVKGKPLSWPYQADSDQLVTITLAARGPHVGRRGIVDEVVTLLADRAISLGLFSRLGSPL